MKTKQKKNECGYCFNCGEALFIGFVLHHIFIYFFLTSIRLVVAQNQSESAHLKKIETEKASDFTHVRTIAGLTVERDNCLTPIWICVAC